MIDFLLFSIRRYARACSYVAVFLAGVGVSISSSYFWIPLAVSIVLGSLAAWQKQKLPPPLL